MRKIIVNHKEYTKQKMSVDMYMEYMDAAEQVGGNGKYTRQDIELMMLHICKAYGNQFTVEELKDRETGLDITGIILEFQFIEMDIANELEKRLDKIIKNFQKGK